MEECCTCKNCGGQTWSIYADRIECAKCRKVEVKFEEDLHPSDLINLTNDNF